MPVYIFHVWTNDRRSNQMNATKMCSVALNRFPHMLWFDVSIKRMKEGEKKRKTKCKMRLFYSTIAIVCHGFFSTCLSIYSALSIHLSFFLYSQLTDTIFSLFTSLVFLCEFILCVLCLQQSTHLEWQLVQPWFHLKCILVSFLSLMLFVKYVEDGFTIKIDCIALKRCLSNVTMDHLSRFCI